MRELDASPQVDPAHGTAFCDHVEIALKAKEEGIGQVKPVIEQLARL
jgi:hypothetical protein